MKKLFIPIILVIAVPSFAQWHNLGLNGEVTAFGVHDSSLFIATQGPIFGPSIFRYTVAHGSVYADSGIDFTQENITSFATIGEYCLAGMTQVDPEGFPNGPGTSWRSSNNGEQWFASAGGNVCVANRYVFNAESIGSQGGIYRSPDSGAYNPWTLVSSFNAITLASIGVNVFACNTSSLMRSTDTGNHWSQLSPPFVGTMVTMDSLLFIVSGGKVIMSADSGVQWSTVTVDSAGTVPETVNCLAANGKLLFAGTPSGVFYSSDIGGHWKFVNTDSIPSGYYNPVAMCVFDTLLAINVTGSGSYLVYTRSIPQITDSTDSAKGAVQEPAIADSLEVYPNPTMGTVTIGGLPIYSITLVNIMGSEVLNLPNVGQTSVTLDVSEFPSGTYFARIQTTDGIFLKKVTIER